MTKQSETRERVLDLIEDLGVGEAIPSERQLTADLGVSRLTAATAAAHSEIGLDFQSGLCESPRRGQVVRTNLAASTSSRVATCNAERA